MFTDAYAYTPCKHLRDPFFCSECEAERKRKVAQEAHDASVRRQRGKLKIAPWRKEEK